MAIDRRRALLALGALTTAPALAASAAPPSGLTFDHGVASGDPLTDRIILWTRVSDADGPVAVTWQVAADDSFATLIAQGTVTTDARRDHTVKVDATGLKPGCDYVYRFVADGVISPIGRTRTLGLSSDKLVLAVASCSLHPNGFFNAYRAISEMPELDAVIHLGDYIYEYGAGVSDYGMGNGRLLMRLPEPAREIVSLDDYRMRHAQYKRDPDLQAAHARAPWICVFDDHEICNNPWHDGAENHNEGEGDWAARKANALTAYAEWMPIRDPEPGRLREAIYRSFRFGKLAELVMMESRLLARSQQLDYTTDLTPGSDGRPDLDAFRARLKDPSREMLGAGQRDWLKTTLDASVREGVRWQIFGNQVVMARVAGPDLTKALGAETLAGIAALLSQGARSQLEAFLALFGGANPMPWNLDAWDGYPAERERVYDMIRDAGARAVVLSGDSHCAWANALSDDSGRPIAAEIGVTSITSPTRWLDAWLPDLHLAETQAAQNAEVVAADDAWNGFVRLTVTQEAITADWMAVSTILSRSFTCFPLRSFRIEAQDGTARLIA